MNTHNIGFYEEMAKIVFGLRNRSALAVNCCVIIHCLESVVKKIKSRARSASDLSSYN